MAIRAALLASLFTPACGGTTALGVPGTSDELDAGEASDGGPRDSGGTVAMDPPPHVVAVDAGGSPCPEHPVRLTRSHVETIFLLDASGSMGAAWDGRPTEGDPPSRWTILRDLLATTLPPFDDTMAIGGKIFPSYRLGCGVGSGFEAPPRLGGAAPLIALMDSWTPRGGTPTADAIERILEQPADGPRVVIAATDGGPNCNREMEAHEGCICTADPSVCDQPSPAGAQACLDAERTLSAARTSYEEHGVPIVVVGIDDPTRPELSDFLDELALAGGWPRPGEGDRVFFHPLEPGNLETAFSELAAHLAHCIFELDVPPPAGAQLVVSIEGEFVPLDASHENGWDWSDRRRGAIVLFGPSCEAVRERDDDGSVSADVVCQD